MNGTQTQTQIVRYEDAIKFFSEIFSQFKAKEEYIKRKTHAIGTSGYVVRQYKAKIVSINKKYGVAEVEGYGRKFAFVEKKKDNYYWMLNDYDWYHKSSLRRAFNNFLKKHGLI